MADIAAAIGMTQGENAAPEKIEPRVILAQMIESSPHNITLDEIEAQPNGYDMGPLTPRLPERLKTQDGLIHCAPEMPMKDLASFRADFTVPAKDAFSLIGRRHLRSNNSWLHNSHRLLKGPNRCTLMIHPDDATGLGLSDGDMAEVSNHVGAVELPVEITEDIMPSVVSMPHGYGHGRKGVKLSVAAEKPGVSMNDLTDPAIVDDLSGNAVLNAVPVQIKKAA
jgi:anaerobic selenocysteine-containing dehydrogenase